MRALKSVGLALLAVSSLVFATQSATANSDSKQQSKSDTQQQVGQQTGQQPGQVAEQPVASKDQEKISLAPHALMTLTSLQSALQEVKGLRAQLDAVPSTSGEALTHVRIYQNEIDQNVDRAVKHDQELARVAQNYPDIMKSSEFKDVSSGLRTVKSQKDTLISKLGDETYLRNKDQVKSDLSTFEKALTDAVNKTDKFASAKLDLKTAVT